MKFEASLTIVFIELYMPTSVSHCPDVWKYASHPVSNFSLAPPRLNMESAVAITSRR
jgi:hypothetical protein